MVCRVMHLGTRKFSLAVFGSIASVILSFTGHLTGSEWVAVQSFLLGLYGAANVTDKKLGGAG